MVHLDEAGRGLGWTEVRPPSARLRTWVEHTWIVRYPLEPGPSATWKIVPDLSPNLLIHDYGARRSVVLVGARTQAVDVPIRRRRWTVGLRLFPGTLPGLNGVSVRALTDGGIRLEALFGRQGREWEERIADAVGPNEVLALAESFVGQLLTPDYRVDWRVRLVLRPDPTSAGLQVGTLAREAGISRRGLRSVFSSHVGLSPKKALSIRRLFAALHSSLRSETTDWSRIAVDAGYHDGAHLSREFRLLLGEPPTTWRARGHAGSYNR